MFTVSASGTRVYSEKLVMVPAVSAWMEPDELIVVVNPAIVFPEKLEMPAPAFSTVVGLRRYTLEESRTRYSLYVSRSLSPRASPYEPS